MPHISEVRIELVPDDCPDASYLDQPEFATRRAAYRRGEFELIGVRALAIVAVEYHEDWQEFPVHTPGIWGVESDGDPAYFRQLYRDELAGLRGMLARLGLTLPKQPEEES